MDWQTTKPVGDERDFLAVLKTQENYLELVEGERARALERKRRVDTER